MKIEKGIPIPDPMGQGSALSGLTETLKTMQIGDSVFLSGHGHTKFGSYYSRFPDRTFTARKTLNGVRIWRTE